MAPQEVEQAVSRARAVVQALAEAVEALAALAGAAEPGLAVLEGLRAPAVEAELALAAGRGLAVAGRGLAVAAVALAVELEARAEIPHRESG
jgi:hypothetical protein